MKQKLEKIRDLLNEIISSLEVDTPILNETQKSTEVIQEIVPLVEEKEFDMLKRLLDSDKWPSAVFQSQIADENSETDKRERAEGISDILLPPLQGKKFLDFGCGEGHIAEYNSKIAELSVGYDIKKSTKSLFDWEELKEKLLLTTDFAKVQAEGPYDVILIYDVLDHVENESMEDVLSKAKSVLSPNGNVYLRCHPWSSRHGSHLYRKMNKAFLHLVFNDEELRTLGLEIEPNQKVLYPIRTYFNAIESAGLEKQSEPEIDTQEVESFFSENPLVRSRILKTFNLNQWKDEEPKFQLSQCFLDYILK